MSIFLYLDSKPSVIYV